MCYLLAFLKDKLNHLLYKGVVIFPGFCKTVYISETGSIIMSSWTLEFGSAVAEHQLEIDYLILFATTSVVA